MDCVFAIVPVSDVSCLNVVHGNMMIGLKAEGPIMFLPLGIVYRLAMITCHVLSRAGGGAFIF